MQSNESLAPPLAVNATNAAALIGISRASFYAAWRAGKAPEGLMIGRRRLWGVEELKAWIAAGAPPRSAWAMRKSAEKVNRRLDALKAG